jgi:hypothetical protein
VKCFATKNSGNTSLALSVDKYVDGASISTTKNHFCNKISFLSVFHSLPFKITKKNQSLSKQKLKERIKYLKKNNLLAIINEFKVK